MSGQHDILQKYYRQNMYNSCVNVQPGIIVLGYNIECQSKEISKDFEDQLICDRFWAWLIAWQDL